MYYYLKTSVYGAEPVQVENANKLSQSTTLYRKDTSGLFYLWIEISCVKLLATETVIFPCTALKTGVIHTDKKQVYKIEKALKTHIFLGVCHFFALGVQGGEEHDDLLASRDIESYDDTFIEGRSNQLLFYVFLLASVWNVSLLLCLPQVNQSTFKTNYVTAHRSLT